VHLTPVIGVVVIWVAVFGQVGPAPPAQDRPAAPAAIEEDLRVRFKVVARADQTVLARVREYLELIVIRNTQVSKFAPGQRRGTVPELELVLLFEPYPKLPSNRRDLGTVNLRLDPTEDAAAIEYCLRRCTETNADVVRYESTLDEFLRKLDAQSAVLARRYK